MTADAASVTAGGAAGFSVTIANTGTDAANNLTLSDPLPDLSGASTWSINGGADAGSFAISGGVGTQSLSLAAGINSLAAGTSLSVHITGTTVPSGSPFVQALSNTATADASNETSHNQQSTASENVLSPNVTVSNAADAASVVAGGAVGFTLTITNTGTGTANGLTLSDPLPDLGGANAWSINGGADAGSFAISGGAGVQSLSLAAGVTSLAAGASLSVHISGTAAPSGSPFVQALSNTATVDATNETSHNQQSTASENVLSPNVTVSNTADAASVTAGGAAGYTVTVTNTGTGTANGLTLTDALPDLGGAQTWSIDGGADAGSFAVSGAGGAQSLSLAAGVTSLAAGASLSVHISGTTTPVGPPASTQTLPNTVTVDASNETDHDQQSTATVTVPDPARPTPPGNPLPTRPTPFVSVTVRRHGEVRKVVLQDGQMLQLDAHGVHLLSSSGGHHSERNVLLITFRNGNLEQFSAHRAVLLGRGVQSAGVAFNRAGEVVSVVLADGTLERLHPFGAHRLGKLF